MAKPLTVQSVEKIAKGAVRREVPDGRQHGLYLVIQPSGEKSWAFRYRFGGRSRKLTLGQYPGMDLVKARRRARRAIEAVDDGRDPGIEKQNELRRLKYGETERDSFANIACSFIERHARPKTRSWKETARLLGLKLDPQKPDALKTIKGSIVARWGPRNISTITKRDILDALDTIIDRGAGTLANRTLGKLRKLFNWAIERDIIEHSPCAGIKPPAPESSRNRVLSDDELALVWNKADSLNYPFKQIVRLLILTGQRRGEVAGCMRVELRLDDRLWCLPRERTKNGEEHDIPLSDAALQVLATTHNIAGEFLFTTTGKTASSGFSKAKRAVDAAIRKETKRSLPSWTFHDLRRTVASGMAALGIAPHIVERVLNHKSGTIKGIAAVYNRHEYAAEKRAALDEWATHVLSIVRNREASDSSDKPAAVPT